MNKDTIEGNWKQMAAKIKGKWAKLTDDDLARAEANKDHLFGKLQEHYGLAKEKAQAHLKELGVTI